MKRFGNKYILALAQVNLVDGEPPEWIAVLPGGALIRARDGRKFRNPKPEQVVKAFEEGRIDLPIDWEHATEIKAPKGEPAPAAGWIKELEVRDGAVWARVEWTKKGRQSLLDKDYRYISPGFFHDRKGNITALSSAGLVNKPALDLPAVARDQGDYAMDPKILEMLGLPPEATPEDVYTAIKQLMDAVQQGQTQQQAAEGDTCPTCGRPAKDTAAMEDEYKSKMAEMEEELAKARSQTIPSLKEFVPREDYNLAMTRIQKLEEAAEADRKKALAAEAEREISEAQKAGKITPATVEYYRKQCSTEEGLELFREFVKVAPVVVPDSNLDERKPPTTVKVLTAEERKFIKTMGLTEEEYLKGAEDEDEAA